MRMRNYWPSVFVAFGFCILGSGIASSEAQQAGRCEAFPTECEEADKAEHEENIRLLLDNWRNALQQKDPDERTRPGCDSPPIRQPGKTAEEYFEILKAWQLDCEAEDSE